MRTFYVNLRLLRSSTFNFNDKYKQYIAENTENFILFFKNNFYISFRLSIKNLKTENKFKARLIFNINDKCE